MRVSGSWANAVYFAESDDALTVPAGFNTVLTNRQWQGVVDFSLAVDAPIVTSFAISAGTRDAARVWKPEQARRLLAASRSMGGRIAAVELMNEPDLPDIAARQMAMTQPPTLGILQFLAASSNRRRLT